MHNYYHPFLFGGFFLVLLFMFIGIHLVLFVIPGFLIIRKTGFSGWWVLLTYVPLGLPVGMWILATARWPIEDRAAQHGAFPPAGPPVAPPVAAPTPPADPSPA